LVSTEPRIGEGITDEYGEMREVAFITKQLIANLIHLHVAGNAPMGHHVKADSVENWELNYVN